MYFVVTLALKMLIYALVNSAFSGIASLKLHLFIQPLGKTGMTNLLFSHPQSFCERSLVVRDCCVGEVRRFKGFFFGGELGKLVRLRRLMSLRRLRNLKSLRRLMIVV